MGGKRRSNDALSFTVSPTLGHENLHKSPLILVTWINPGFHRLPSSEATVNVSSRPRCRNSTRYLPYVDTRYEGVSPVLRVSSVYGKLTFRTCFGSVGLRYGPFLAIAIFGLVNRRDFGELQPEFGFVPLSGTRLGVDVRPVIEAHDPPRIESP